MNILSQNYNNLLKKLIFDVFTSNLKDKLNSLNPNEDVFNYVSILSNLDESLCVIAKECLVNLFESLDYYYSISRERKSKYEIKSHHPRTILTIFGEITYNRTFYKSKLTGKNFCYVDRYLGLHKYDYFDPYLKALVVEYAANNSYPKTAKYINELISNRISIDDKFKYLSRQTIRNIIMSAKFSKVKCETSLDTPSEIHIIADEKWINTQNNDKQPVMEKSIVLFESIDNHKLINKQIFSSLDHSFIDDCLDYIYDKYDIDKINTIYCLGDGATWIKNLAWNFYFDKNTKVISGLDKFHFKQALHHICQDKNLENILTGYVLNNKKKDFKLCCESLIYSYPHRKDTIESKMTYILNNWFNINCLYKYNLSCPMESQISHNIADLFTARPKAYSIKTIKQLTKLRMLYKNNQNIKKLYLNNFNSNEIITINKEKLNFDIFERNKQFIPLYEGKLYHPVLQYF